MNEPVSMLSPAEEKFEMWRRRFGIVFTPIAFLLVYWFCDGLTPEGRKLSAILAGVCVLWISEVVALPVSGLIGAVMCVLLGVAPARNVFANFADPIVFVFLGGFMLAKAMHVHGLDRRLALGFLSIRQIGSSPGMVLGGFGFITAFISMWVSNTATTAMMLPIGIGILTALHAARVQSGLMSGPLDARRWPYATALMLMIAYGASIGGIGTPVGSPPNLIGIGLMRKSANFEVSFFQWMAMGIPLFLLMGIVLFVLLRVLHPEKVQAGDTSAEELFKYIKAEREKVGPWSQAQINTLIGFGAAVTLWVLPGLLALPMFAGNTLGPWMNSHVPESVGALVGAILLFVLPFKSKEGYTLTLTWEQAVRIDWGTILLFGGGLALGTLMFETGVATALGKALTDLLGAQSLWALTGLSIGIGIVLSEATSNTAASNMVIPVVIAIAVAAGVSPIPPALGACLGCSFGFMLPVSTPPNAIVYGSGLVPLPRMVRAGVLFDITGFFIIWAGLRILCPLIGLM